MKRTLVTVSLFVAAVGCSSSDTGTGGAGDAGVNADAGSSGRASACTAAREQLLVPIAKVATAEVKVIAEAAGVTTVYVDASAGGFDQARKNPRVYITLAGQRVDVSDADAVTSATWDLALKRQVLFTNGGDAGPGAGAGILVEKPFEAVTAADAQVRPPVAETFFDAECNARKDEIEDPLTSFTGWYDYDSARMRATPRPDVTFLVKSAVGALFKVGITSYTGRPDGSTTAPATGFFLVRIAAL